MPEIGAGAVGRLSTKRDGAVAPTAHRNRVLIVEDSQIVRARLSALIQGLVPDVEVDQASDGVEAARLFHEREPLAVFLDIELPRISGLNLLAEFKRARPFCVIVVLTTYAFKELGQHCAALGADHFFDKASEFMRAIDVLVALMRSRDPGTGRVA